MTLSQEQNDDDKPDLNKIGMLITLPFVLAVPPIAGLLFGMWLDKLFDLEPYLMYFFLILGLAAGIREFYRLLKRTGSLD